MLVKPFKSFISKPLTIVIERFHYFSKIMCMSAGLDTLLLKKQKQPLSDQTKSKLATIASAVGIACNVILFIFKFIIGSIAGSVTIVNDGLNNLSDCAGCVVSMWGYHMAAKPADSDHPFGHGRAEYIATFVVAIFILFVGYEAIGSSIDKIIHPQPLSVTGFTIAVLIGSILVKLWMGLFYKGMGNGLANTTLQASSQDSFNDTLITLASLIAVWIEPLTNLPIDGLLGAAVSLFILYGGVKLLKETIEELIGQTPSKDLMQQVSDYLESNPVVLGVHDLMFHYYGSSIYASLHAEVDSEGNILDIHDTIDNLERDVLKKFNVHLTIHMDTVELHNPRLNYYKPLVEQYLTRFDGSITMHDFRVVSGSTHDNCIFDLSLPFESEVTIDQIKSEIEMILNSKPYDPTSKVYCVINVDHH